MDLFSIATWVIAALSLIGVILNIRKDKRCFIFFTVGNAGWIVIDLMIGLYAQVLLFFVLTLLSIYGYIAWKREETKAIVD